MHVSLFCFLGESSDEEQQKGETCKRDISNGLSEAGAVSHKCLVCVLLFVFRLGSYIKRCMDSQMQWGLLYGFRLTFNKRGISQDAGGFPNIEFCPTASVEGCLHLITPEELQRLDKAMGYPEVSLKTRNDQSKAKSRSMYLPA